MVDRTPANWHWHDSMSIGWIISSVLSAPMKCPHKPKRQRTGGTNPAVEAAFFEAVRKALGSLPFIADDLGAITPDVVALLDQLQIPGTRVLQFEFGAKLETNSDPPAPHPVKSVVYTGTHDNDTTAGWYREVAHRATRSLAKTVGSKQSGGCLGHDWQGAGIAGRHRHRSRPRPSGVGVGGANEFSRNCERKLALAPEGWRTDPRACAKTAQHNHDKWTPGW